MNNDKDEKVNDKYVILLKIVDIVVECCAMPLPNGGMSVTREMVLGKCRKDNVCLTRIILCRQIVNAGYTIGTIAELLDRTPNAIRKMLKQRPSLYDCSRAFRIAEAEATLRCRDLGI